MMYLLQSDRECIDLETQISDAIVNLKHIFKINLIHDNERKAFILQIHSTDRTVGWLAIYKQESTARAVLADLLDHMKQDNLMAQMIKCDEVNRDE